MPHSIADRDSGLWTSGIIEKIGSVTNWPTELTLHPTPSLSPQGTPVMVDTRCWLFPSHPFYYIQLMFCCSTFPSLFLFFSVRFKISAVCDVRRRYLLSRNFSRIFLHTMELDENCYFYQHVLEYERLCMETAGERLLSHPCEMPNAEQ